MNAVKRFLQPVAFVLISMGLGWAIYANTLHVPFYLDDYSQIVENPWIKQFPPVMGLFRFDPLRFLPDLTFALNFFFGGLDVEGYHLVNILFHAANTLLVFLLLNLILKTQGGSEPGPQSSVWAWAAALIFLVHPLQTQAVTYIVQRITLMGAFFSLTAMFFYLNFRLGGKRAYYQLALAASFLGMISKEIVLCVPLFLILIEFFVCPSPEKGFRQRVLYIAPFFLIWIVVPVAVMMEPWMMGELDAKRTGMTWTGYAVTQPRVIMTYLRLLVVPVGQSLEYDFPVYHSLTALPVLLSCAILAVIAGAGVLLYRSCRMISFGIFFFFIALLPESSVIPLKDVIFEHRLYLALLGYALIVTQVIRRFLSPYRWVVLIGLIGILSVLSYQRNRLWGDPITFLKDNLVRAPENVRAFLNLGNYYMVKGKLADAAAQYREAIRLDAANYHAYNNLGMIDYRSGRRDRAKENFNRALQIKSDFVQPYFNLGRMAFEEGDFRTAEQYFGKAVQVDPQYSSSYIGYALLYDLYQNQEMALRSMEKAIELSPYDAEAHYQLGNLLYKYGKIGAAVDSYTNAIRINHDFVEAINNLGNIMYSLRKYWLAEGKFLRVVKLRPDFAGAYLNLANLYHATKQYDKAEKYSRRARDIAMRQGDVELLEKMKKAEETRQDFT